MQEWKTLQKIKELRGWVIYIDENQLPEVSETEIKEIVD